MDPRTRKNLTDSEAAARYGMSRAWFQRKRWEGGGPSFIKLPGRAGRVLYPEDELDRYFESRIRISTSDPGPAPESPQKGKQMARMQYIGKGDQAPAAGCSSLEKGNGGRHE